MLDVVHELVLCLLCITVLLQVEAIVEQILVAMQFEYELNPMTIRCREELRREWPDPLKKVSKVRDSDGLRYLTFE